jgi:type IV pilus assembly protein PilW
MRVGYGVANAGSTTLAAWRSAADAGWAVLDAGNIGRVRAVRLGLLVRSAQRDKPDADGQCRASTTLPTLFDEIVEPDVSDWQCWRFRASTVIVPLRNLTWGQTP